MILDFREFMKNENTISPRMEFIVYSNFHRQEKVAENRIVFVVSKNWFFCTLEMRFKYLYVADAQNFEVICAPVCFRSFIKK